MDYKQFKINHFFLLGTITFLVFIFSLKNGFIWDDRSIIFNQIHAIKGLNIYKPNFIYYRPLTQISFLLDFLVWRYCPFGYHLTNILIHIANVLLVYGLFSKIFIRLNMNSSWTFWSALIFAVHPVHVESVSWIAGRTDLLVTFFSLFVLMAAHVYLETKEKKMLFFMFTFFLLALASKEMAVILIPILLIESLIFKDKFFSMVVFTVMLLGIVYMVFKLPALKIYGWHFNLGSLIKAFGFYIKSLVFPLPFYAYMPSLPDWGIVVALFFIMICFVLFGFTKLKREEREMGLIYMAGFVISLIPVMALIVFRIGATPVAWRYLYLPSVFFILSFCILLNKCIKTHFYLLPIIFFYGFITVTHQQIWQSDFCFWQNAVKIAGKDHAIPHHQYALSLWKKGELKQAEHHFILALKAKDIQQYPWEKAKVYNTLGCLYAAQKKWSKAKICFLMALKYNPQYRPAMCNLGKVYLTFYKKKHNQELRQEAERLLKECH
jgi:tetratricopeptide (TPR) repeat protein